MNVILLEKVENLGGIGDQVKVKSGYARNFLLPQGKALLATSENVTKMEALRAELEAKENAEQGTAQERAAGLTGLVVTIESRVGPGGKLFGSVGPLDVVDAIAAMGHEVQRSEIRMADGAIRVPGDHSATLHLHSDVNVDITIRVTGDGSEMVSIEEIEEDSTERDAADTIEETPASE